MELTERKLLLLKAAVKCRVSMLNLSKSSMTSSFKIGLGSLDDVHKCSDDIKEYEELLAELEWIEP